MSDVTLEPLEAKRKLVIPGGAGFCGRAVAKWFVAKGWDVVVLSRGKVVLGDGVRVLKWDGETVGEWARELDGCDAVVNMAGRSVNCRYHARNRTAIMDSRIKSTRAVGQAIAACVNPPPVWLNSSTATIYRHAEDRPQDEAGGEIGTGFSINVATAWEKEFLEAPVPDFVRKVALRTAIVFGVEQGTVFDLLVKLTRRGLGGKMGNGNQRVSWVHEHDFARAVEFLIESSELSGAVNISAPGVVTNAEMMQLIREVTRMPIGLPATRWMLEIGAVFMRTETELILKSRWVASERLKAAGFVFWYPDFRKAVEELYYLGDSRHE